MWVDLTVFDGFGFAGNDFSFRVGCDSGVRTGVSVLHAAAQLEEYYGYPVFHPAMLMVVFMLMFMLMVMMSMLSCFVFHNYVFIMVLFTGAKV